MSKSKGNPKHVLGGAFAVAVAAGIGLIFQFLLLTVMVSCAKKGAAPPPAQADQPAMTAQSGYGDAIKQIQARMASLDTTIKAGKHYAVHNDAEAIVELSGSLETLAAAPGSGVPRDKVPEVTDLARELAAASNDMHGAGHANDMPRFNQRYSDMIRLVESLAQYDRSAGAGIHEGRDGEDVDVREAPRASAKRTTTSIAASALGAGARRRMPGNGGLATSRLGGQRGSQSIPRQFLTTRSFSCNIRFS